MLCKQVAHVLSLALRFPGYKSKDSGGQRQGQTGAFKQEQRGFLVELQMSYGNSEWVVESHAKSAAIKSSLRWFSISVYYIRYPKIARKKKEKSSVRLSSG